MKYQITGTVYINSKKQVIATAFKSDEYDVEINKLIRGIEDD